MIREESPQRMLSQLIDEKVDREAEQRLAQITEEEFAQKSASIYERMNSLLERPIDESVQLALAKAIRLLTDIATTDILWLRRNPQLLDAVDASIQALLRNPPQLKLAQRIQRNVYRRLHPWLGAGLYASLRRSAKQSPIAVIVCGLFVMFALLTFVPLLSRDFNLNALTIGELLSINPAVLLLIGGVGAIGAIVSIMMRIKGLQDDLGSYGSNVDPWPFFFFGLFKPLVGAVFALFAFAAIRSGIIPISVPDDEGWLFVALAFIAGFSERFAGDVVAGAEQTLGSSVPLPTPPLAPPSGNGATVREAHEAHPAPEQRQLQGEADRPPERGAAHNRHG